MRRALLGLALLACAGGPPVPLDPSPSSPLAAGETRQVELRALRLDVKGYRQQLDIAALRALPRSTLADIWLFDLDVRPLLVNTLRKVQEIPETEVARLPTPARNLKRLLDLTPDNADLRGTSMEQLLSLARAVGVPPARALANLLGRAVTDRVLPVEDVADALLDGMVKTHPNAQWRKGPITAEHPDGRYPVAPGAIPVTLADVASNFEDLAQRFGPVGDHPGLVRAAHGVTVIEKDFRMNIRISANALPYKGIDLDLGQVANVNSTGSQIETLFDFDDPQWMQLDGLVPDPIIRELTILVPEARVFMPGGRKRAPEPTGDSEAWALEPWVFERLVLDMTRRMQRSIPEHCDTYTLGTGTTAFKGCIDAAGWVELQTFANVGAPPPPSYLWDLQLEIAQVRLHDEGLAEGQANVELTLRDVAVGVPPARIVEAVRRNAREQPAAFRDFAQQLTDGEDAGEADFFYLRPAAARPDEPADYLCFVAPTDIPVGKDGKPVRPYGYQRPGFFADAARARKLSSPLEVDGDTTHDKVRVKPGDELYVEDDRGRVFRVRVGDKPSPGRLALDVTRVP